MSVKDSIKSLDFFNSLNDIQTGNLISISTINSYDENYVLYYEKKQSNQLLFLVKGLAKAYKIDKQDNEIFLYYIHKNSIISEISNLENDFLHSFSNVELIQKSKILSIDYKQFKSLFLNKDLLNKEFTNEIISHSQKLQTLINREFIFDSVSKVAMMIDSNLDMFNRLPRNNISLILHINPATLSRVLNRLKRNKIIDIIHGKVIILNILELKAIFEG